MSKDRNCIGFQAKKPEANLNYVGSKILDAESGNDG
jgi:hypothetical protein